MYEYYRIICSILFILQVLLKIVLKTYSLKAKTESKNFFFALVIVIYVHRNKQYKTFEMFPLFVVIETNRGYFI